VVSCSGARLTSSPTGASLAGESWVARPDTSSSSSAPRSYVARLCNRRRTDQRRPTSWRSTVLGGSIKHRYMKTSYPLHAMK
jgi:hypothetical protein